MTLAFETPECPSSVISRLDPRWKLASILIAIVALAPVRTPGPASCALLGALLLVALARLPWRWYLTRLATGLLMFALFLIWLPFVVEEGHATLDIGVVTVSMTGLERLLVLTAKLAAMISLMLVLLATTPLHDTFKAAHALRIPGLLIQIVLLTYRYVFLLIEEFERLRTALRVRAFRSRTDLHTYRTVGQLAGTLVVRSGERAERVGQAMRCRGFDGSFRSLHDFQTRGADVLAFTLIVSYAALLVAWDWLAR